MSRMINSGLICVGLIYFSMAQISFVSTKNLQPHGKCGNLRRSRVPNGAQNVHISFLSRTTSNVFLPLTILIIAYLQLCCILITEPPSPTSSWSHCWLMCGWEYGNIPSIIIPTVYKDKVEVYLKILRIATNMEWVMLHSPWPRSCCEESEKHR
ncbi:hypothetical protein HID58_088614 [Brassica napus]|uniref:BnaC09g37420D protein n=2 Tax=Brassica napus TaxID=3708 RepID=A0A078HBM4_BRANA|nr:hypothetical protein HID58_088614 [Brassica napus]CAF1776706.1 unnamed protein product [Brassica napus]CDY35810.1 BnaC09g37420D [Brassica napus]